MVYSIQLETGAILHRVDKVELHTTSKYVNGVMTGQYKRKVCKLRSSSSPSLLPCV